MIIYAHRVTGWRVVIEDNCGMEGYITFHNYPEGFTCRLLAHEFRQQYYQLPSPKGEMKVVIS